MLFVIPVIIIVYNLWKTIANLEVDQKIDIYCPSFQKKE